MRKQSAQCLRPAHPVSAAKIERPIELVGNRESFGDFSHAHQLARDGVISQRKRTRGNAINLHLKLDAKVKVEVTARRLQ
jgi:hypothetical protein